MIGMKTLPLIFVTIVATAVQSGVTFGQTAPDQKAAEIPSDLLATLRKDVKEDKDDKACLEEPDSPPLEGQIVTSWLDLKRLQQAALVVRGVMPCLGGNDNGELFLYIRAGNGWRQILHTWGQGVEVCAQAISPCPVPIGSGRRSIGAHGWPDLELWRHASASEGDQIVYRFDGNVYKAVACNHVQYDNPERSKPWITPCEVPSDF
jgi:hypothetical protein